MPKQIRPIRIEGKVAYVTLTKGYEAVIDAVDVHLVDDRNWCALVSRRRNGTVRSVYAQAGIRRDHGMPAVMMMHRVIAGTPDKLHTDHADGDGLNNRRNNLRIATHAENQHNQHLSVANSSGFKGVHWHKRDKKWVARIKMNGKERHLGNYETPEAAHDAYCEASTKMHGEFGWATP